MDMKEMKLLSEWSYEPAKIHRGYAERTLYVGLGNKDGNYKFEKRPVSDDMIEKFTGGRGFGLKLLWDAVTEKTKVGRPRKRAGHRGRSLLRYHPVSGTGKIIHRIPLPCHETDLQQQRRGYFGPSSSSRASTP